jgi:signal transduction histidine kinase
MLLFFLLTYFINAQNAQDIIDGLKRDLKTNPDDKKRVTIYSDLTWYYSNVSLDSAMAYGKKAIIESTKLGDSILIAQAYSDVGAVYFRRGDFDQSKHNYLIAYRIRKIRKDIAGLAKININLASIYTSKQDYKKAMITNLEALKYFESINNEQVIATTKANMGYIFRELKNYSKAIKYLNEAIQYQEKNNLNDGLCKSYVNIGNSYLEIKDTLKAIFYMKKGFKICEKVGDKTSISSLYNNFGVVKTNQNKSKEAKILLNESSKIRVELNSDLGKASLQLNIATEYIKAKKYVEAKILLLKIKTIFENKKSNENLLLTYNQLIPVCAKLEQTDSVISYSDLYSKLKDKMIESIVLKQTSELETKYQTTKKEKQIIQQQADAKQKNIYLIGLSVLGLLIGLVGFLIFKQQKQKNQQQTQEFALKSAIAKIENQNKLQEQRLSISRDLHDNIGSQLTFIISSVENVKYGFEINNPKLDNKLTNISSFAKDTILELRDTIWAMNSNEISYEDLEIRINNFIDKAKLSQENISFSFAIDESLKDKKQTSVEGMNVYRTIQEAINNALKYAQANIISVNIKTQASQTAINIKDNGKGFDIETTEKGNGLKNMQKRIEEIGGQFNLTSNSDGTRIEILI